MTFSADFIIEGDVAFTNEKIQFISLTQDENGNPIGIGLIPDSYITNPDFQVVGDVELDELITDDGFGGKTFKSGYDSVTVVTKKQWETENGITHIGDTFITTFEDTGDVGITLSYYSEMFNYQGRLFRYKISNPKDVRINSMFYKLITDNYPLFEKAYNIELDDLFFSISVFFERIYKDNKKLFDNIDIQKISPNLLEYMASTLGHTDDYVRKIGSDVSKAEFDDYDIFERIKNNLATNDEIQTFRRFLLFSAELFNKKGTPNDIISLLSFYKMTSKVDELWTKNWGTDPIGVSTEIFSGLTSFDDNNIGLKWLNLRVVGNSNDDGHFKRNFNSITIDSYHENQKIEFPTDIHDEDDENYIFKIDKRPYYILGLIREDGEELVDVDLYDPVNFYEVKSRKKTNFLHVKKSILNFGDRLSLLYRTSKEDNLDSLVATTDKKQKNIEAIITFNFSDITDQFKNENSRLPENEIFVSFRGIENEDTDIYANFNEYYRFGVNFRRNTFSLSKVIEQNGSVVSQNINLAEDKDNLVWDSLIIDNNDEELQFDINLNYQISVKVIDNHVSLYVREADAYNEIKENIDSDIGGIEFGKSNSDWICLIDSLNLQIDQNNILSLDQNGDEVISVEYKPILSKGSFGIGSRTSILNIEDIYLNNLDPDDLLYNDVDKELQIKPKYHDWQNNKLAYYNSYDSDANSFSKVIDKDFSPLNKEYIIGQQSLSSLQFLYFDDASVNELIGSRYTITFNQEYIDENFSSGQEILDKIIIPIGEQPSLCLFEQRIQSKDFYKNALGGDDINIPGFANANYTPTLTDYKTIPYDSFSELNRTERNFGKNLYLSNKIREYKNGTENLFINGVWEEIAPKSTTWPQLGDSITLADGSSFNNKLLFPIIVNYGNIKRTIGIKFRHCSDIQTIIDRATFDLNDQIPIYGSFIFEVPEESVKFRANQEYEFEESEIAGHVKFRSFLPLGVLQKDIQNYSLGVEFIHKANNSGATNIRLDGVYVNYPAPKFIYHDSENRIELDELNPFERKDKGLYVRYFLNSQVNLGCTLEDFESPNDIDRVPNKFMMSYPFRKMLKSLEKESGYNPDLFLDSDSKRLPEQDILDIIYDNWNWWRPERVYRKRDFIRLNSDNNGESISTGFNFDASVNQAKSFFGTKYNSTDYPNGVPSQKFSLTDGKVNPNTVYYAKVTFRQHWSGYNGLSLTPSDSQPNLYNRPLTSQEEKRIEILGTQDTSIASHIMSPTNQCHECLIPISWYQSPEENTIEWGNYIIGCHGLDSDPTITLTPFGLMTWMFQHSNGTINIEEFSNGVGQVTSGWTVADWNERFWDVVTIDFITEEIPQENFKLMDEFGFSTKYAPRTGSYVEAKHDIGSLDWHVPGNSFLVPTEGGGYYFEIPKQIKPFRRWNEDVNELLLNNYILPASLYETVNNDTIRLSNDQLFDSFDKACFKSRLFFDFFFENSYFETIIDDFNNNRDLNYIVYENIEGDKYELAMRSPNTMVALGVPQENDDFYQLVSVNGLSAFKRIDESTLTEYDPKQLGSNTGNNLNVIEDKNGGNKKTIYFLDNNNEAFNIKTTFIFDEVLNEAKNYNGKKFELILKAESNFNGTTKKYNVEEYYFVGVGTFGFDIALGVARYDFFNDTVEKTFLAGFGDYNTRNIKTNQWYDLKATVDNQYIRVFFNESDQNERVVINYNIDPANKDNVDRYLKGEFEELVYLVTGLKNLDITYPDRLLDKTNSSFVKDNWNEQYAKSIRPSGPLAGFRVFNDLTYISEVSYDAKIQDNRKYGQVYDVSDISEVIDKIKVQFNPAGEVSFIGKTLNNTIVVLIGVNLFYKLVGKEVTQYSDDVDTLFVFKDKVIIKFIYNKSNVVIVDDDFKFTRNIFVKDSSINIDHIFKYQKYTNRKIIRSWVSNGKLHVEFATLEDECNPWGFSVWGEPVWGCFNASLFGN